MLMNIYVSDKASLIQTCKSGDILSGRKYTEISYGSVSNTNGFI